MTDVKKNNAQHKNNNALNDVLTYEDAGVDVAKGNAFVDIIKPLAQQTKRPGLTGSLGGFGGLFDLKKTGFRDPLLVAANDGVGTKLKVAIETGLHNTIGIDLVAMCVNDLVVQGAEPLFFLDYYASAKLDLKVGHDIMTGIAKGCQMAGAALIGGETAEMPGLYNHGDYDLAGFAVGAVERENVLPRLNALKAGDVLIALPSNGLHSNGFSLVRKLITDLDLTYSNPAPFAKHASLGEALLQPTEIYVKPVLQALQHFPNIKALAHITGGGLTENIPRVLSETLNAHINLDALHMPNVFPWLAQAGNIAERDMLQTFNCGVGMVFILPQEDARSCIAWFKNKGIQAYLIGELTLRQANTPLSSPQVQYSGQLLM